MVKTPSFKRLILRAVLRQVSPMVIRLVSVSDQMPLHEFHDVFRTNGDLGYMAFSQQSCHQGPFDLPSFRPERIFLVRNGKA
jgi:hypothetical protein